MIQMFGGHSVSSAYKQEITHGTTHENYDFL